MARIGLPLNGLEFDVVTRNLGHSLQTSAVHKVESVLESRFRYITSSGQEDALAGVPELVLAITSGRISPSTMLFDATSKRWATASDHDAFRAVLLALNGQSNAASGVSQTGAAFGVAEDARLGSQAPTRERVTSPAVESTRSLDDELRDLDADFASAVERGFDSPLLSSKYAAERKRIETEFGRGASTSDEKALAWRRYFARMIDLVLASIVAGFSLGIYNAMTPATGLSTIDVSDVNDYVAGMLVSIIWIPCAAFAISKWGRTPGKALLGMRVRSDTAPSMSFGTALNREAQVCFAGTALGFPFIALVTTWSSKRRLETVGRTAWDESLGLHVVRS